MSRFNFISVAFVLIVLICSCCKEERTIPVWTETDNGYNFGNEIVLASEGETKTPNESYSSLHVMEFASPEDWDISLWYSYSMQASHKNSNTFRLQDGFYRSTTKWYWSDIVMVDDTGYVVSSEELTLRSATDTNVDVDILGYVQPEMALLIGGFAGKGLSYALVRSVMANQPIRLKMNNVCARFGSLRINTPNGYSLSNVSLTSFFFTQGDFSINEGYDFVNDKFYNDGRGGSNLGGKLSVSFTEPDVDYYKFGESPALFDPYDYLYCVPGNYEFVLSYTISGGMDSATYQKKFTIMMKGGISSHIVVNVPPMGTDISNGSSNDNGWVTVTPGEEGDENVEIEW